MFGYCVMIQIKDKRLEIICYQKNIHWLSNQTIKDTLGNMAVKLRKINGKNLTRLMNLREIKLIYEC